MGRPLNKKYFGNKRAPYTDFQGRVHPESGTGFEGIASFTIGGDNDNYTDVPTVTSIDAPTGIGGVQAVAGTITMTAKSATVDTIGTGTVSADYFPGNTLSVDGDTDAVFSIDSVKIRTVTVADDGTTVWTTGDTLTLSGDGWYTVAVLTVTANAGAITNLAITNAGVYTGVAVSDPISVAEATVADGGGYKNDATVNIGFGVNEVSLVSGGSFTSISSNPVATTTNSTTGGTGAKLNVSYGIASIAVGTAGSGYLVVPSVTLSGGNATATAVLSNSTVAIKAVAYIGGAALTADIIKQSSDRRYKVESANGVSVCQLKTTGAPTAIHEMTIGATDSAGGTYYVARLTAHKVILVPGGNSPGSQFASGKSAKWSLFTTIEGKQVVIDTV